MNRRALYSLLLPLLPLLAGATSQNPDEKTSAPANGALTRVYTAGEVLHYQMKGDNQGWQYSLLATDTVKRDAAGSFYEEIGWSGLQSNAPMTLSPASLALRQTVSLEDPRRYMVIPDLSHTQPTLIGPITDTLTFYSDLVRLMDQKISPAHPHAYVQQGTPNSWADGQHYLVAEDAIDFDLNFGSEDKANHTATFTVRHVPPAAPKITLAAEWMKAPVSDAPNNWVEVSHQGLGYLVELGKETFDVKLVVDTRDGKLISAHIENPVTGISRQCEDATLTHCASATPENIHREVSYTLQP